MKILASHLLCICLILQGLSLSAQVSTTELKGQELKVQAAAADKGRQGGLDMILLLDKSLSMAPFFGEVKRYVAGQVLGPILVPGDRLIIELVWGKTENFVPVTTINSNADIERIIRSLNTIKADGHFTDLGRALDTAAIRLKELGEPSRPKFVLLVTDERQEAPKSSPYQAVNHKLIHQGLDYVVKKDLGKFRAITVGLDVGARIAEVAPELANLLLEQPRRGPHGEILNPITDRSQLSDDSIAGRGLGSGTAQGEKAMAQVNQEQHDFLSSVARVLGGSASPWPYIVGILLLLLILAFIIATIIAISKRRRKTKDAEETKRRPNNTNS